MNVEVVVDGRRFELLKRVDWLIDCEIWEVLDEKGEVDVICLMRE
jgi:hypothetical protein